MYSNTESSVCSGKRHHLLNVVGFVWVLSGDDRHPHDSACWQGNTGATATTPWTDMGIGAFEFTTGFDAASGTVTGQSVNLSVAGFFFCVADALVPGP
jgi:hypothetical protein